MKRHLIALSLAVLAGSFVGCGSGSGIKEGIPTDANSPIVNPTPDMESTGKPEPKGR